MKDWIIPILITFIIGSIAICCGIKQGYKEANPITDVNNVSPE